MSRHHGTAVPLHTFIRYQANPIGSWDSWRPVATLRWRLFVNATHKEVTGEKRGAHWVHDWSCDVLCFAPDGTAYWNCNGRNEWPTLEAAQAAVAEYTCATFEEALAQVRASAEAELRRRKRQVEDAQRMFGAIDAATAPILESVK